MDREYLFEFNSPAVDRNLYEKRFRYIRRLLIKSFAGVQGAVFQKRPLVAEGKE